MKAVQAVRGGKDSSAQQTTVTSVRRSAVQEWFFFLGGGGFMGQERDLQGGVQEVPKQVSPPMQPRISKTQPRIQGS